LSLTCIRPTACDDTRDVQEGVSTTGFRGDWRADSEDGEVQTVVCRTVSPTAASETQRSIRQSQRSRHWCVIVSLFYSSETMLIVNHTLQ